MLRLVLCPFCRKMVSRSHCLRCCKKDALAIEAELEIWLKENP